MDKKPTTTTNEVTSDPWSGPSPEFIDPKAQLSGSQRSRSPMGKIVDAIKKPFKKDDEVPPALQENIEKMKIRQQERIMEMQKEGLDTSMLEGSTRGRLRQTLR